VTDPFVYLFDADVFMTAARSYYAFDVALAFWAGLVHQASNGRLLSIDRVKDEIERGKDDLVEWASSIFQPWFASTAQDDVVAAYRDIMQWVQSERRFLDYAKEEFARGADGWLVAYGQAKGCMVVTNEKFEPDIKRRIKIPNVCQAFGVQYVNTFAMMRALGITL